MDRKRQTNLQGKLAEDFAVRLLIGKGYQIIDRNFRSRFGEIDIVAVKEDYLSFVEVKARWSNRFGLAEEAVTRTKLWKIGKTGEYYSILHPDLPKKLRIEVVALEMREDRINSFKIITVCL